MVPQAAPRFSETLPPVEALRAWLRLFVAHIATKQVMSPVLASMVAGPSELYAESGAQVKAAIASLVDRASPVATSGPTSTHSTCCAPWPESPVSVPPPAGRRAPSVSSTSSSPKFGTRPRTDEFKRVLLRLPACRTSTPRRHGDDEGRRCYFRGKRATPSGPVAGRRVGDLLCRRTSLASVRRHRGRLIRGGLGRSDRSPLCQGGAYRPCHRVGWTFRRTIDVSGRAATS
jgi:hypothetical protein